jgi:hypothetical protein
VKADEIDVAALKTQVATLFTKINGNDKKCYADLYNDGTENKKVLIICFSSDTDFSKLNDLFSILNPLDLKNQGEALDPTTEQKFLLHFTDGMEAYTNKTITFKSDGLYENSKLLFRYEFLDAMDGKKCNVYHNLPIFPIKFLDSEILFSKCLFKFKYNQIETYMANTDKNCEEIAKYIAVKMRNSCLNFINGEGNKYGNDLISRPSEGKWTGWANYHKIMDNGGEVIPDLFKVEINLEKINVYDNTTTIKEVIDYRDIQWNCNDMGECNVWEYMQFLKKTFQTMKLSDFHLALKKIKEVWNLQDINFCFVIDEKDTHVICPRDVSEEVNARKALAIATDMKMFDAETKQFLVFPNNKTFFITKVSDSDPYLKDFVIKVKEDKIFLNDDNKEGEVFLDYLAMKPINEIKCGMEFRHISLPIAYHEVNPICCARYLTDENNFICIQHQAKCYIVLRKLIKTIRSNCLVAQKVKITNSTDDPNFPISPVNPEKKNDSVKAWSGEVIFTEIDNYKYKGEVAIEKGFLKITDNDILISVAQKEAFNVDLLTLKFICLSEFMCLPEEYKCNQEIYLEKNYDREWQEATSAKFWAANPTINQNDCMVITSEDAEKEVSQMILVCTASKNEGQNLRESITDIYSKKISKIHDNSNEFAKIPTAHDNSEFEAEVITSSEDGKTISSSTSSTILKIMGDGIIYKTSGANFILYSDLMDPKTLKINMKYTSVLVNTPASKLKKGINPQTCFSINDIGGKLNVCMKKQKRGFYDKVSLFQAIHTKAQFMSLSVIKNENRENYLNGVSAEDTFDFGIVPNYKKFSKSFNIDNLSQDTFEISKNGIWEGWVYEGTLTERNYKKVFTPVFCKIENGLMEFRTDEGKNPPYKVLKLEEYDQVCTTHCKPNEYVSHSQKFKKNVDDHMYLDKTINNYMGQMKYPYINEACVVMDFMSPIFQYGQQHIICAVDKSQGDKIRLAIENLYYTSLLNLNIVKGVRRPNTYTDRYFGRLIINDKYVKEFNNFFVDEYGIVGHLIYEQVGSKQRITNNIFNVTYSQIDNDNFGTTCAFWFINLKIKQQNQDMLKVITDNNCCFRFYTKKDKRKIEICTFNPDGRICIKQARELMKGMKLGCREANNEGKQPNNVSIDQKDEPLDIYQKNTLDDNENGVFEGFAYFGNAINSHQQPRSNPHFVKIGKESIDFFEDHLQLKAKYSVSVDNFVFSCKGQLSCSPSNFLQFAQTHQKYMSVQNQIKTIYNIFMDSYSLQVKDFEENCFVLETVKVPILICAYMQKQGNLLKKALSNTFKLKFLRVKLSSVPQPQNKIYKIIFRKELAEVSDEVELTMNGLLSKHTKQNIFDYRNIDSDPVTQGRCAIWYKSLKASKENPNSTPNPILLKQNCCFKFYVKSTKYFICADNKEGVCINDTFQLMKAIWNGCRYANPNQEQILVSPDSEILGQLVYQNNVLFDAKQERYDIQPLDRINLIFQREMIKRKFFIDSYNEISFSRRRSLYHGWVNIYPLNIQKENKFQILKYYARITPETFSFYETSHMKTKAKLIIRPDMLSMVCAKGAACLPNEYINSFLIKYDPKFAFYKQFFKSKFDFYELGKEEGCSVLENFIENEPNYFVICPRFRFHRTMSKSMQALIDNTNSNFSKNRIMLSTTYGKILREIIYNAYITARKYVRGALLFDLKQTVQHAKISVLLKKQEYEKVGISDKGIISNGQIVVKFDDLQNCLVQYNLIYVPEDMYVFRSKPVYNKNKPQCCMRFNGPVAQEYACFGDLNCEYFTYEFAYKFNVKCVARRNRQTDDLYNELNAGDNVALKPLIKRLFKEEVTFTNIKSLEVNPNLSTQDNSIKQKSLLIKYMYELRDIMHEVNKVEIKSSRKLNSSPQDTTPADPINTEISSVSAKYIGQSFVGEWEVTAAKNRITKYKQAKKSIEVNVVKEIQYVKTKNFFAVIAENSKYVLISYTDTGIKHIGEIFHKISLHDSSKDLVAGVYKSNYVF